MLSAPARYAITRDARDDLDCKAQQLVALRDHDPNHGCGGQQADCKALAHVPWRLYTARALKGPAALSRF